MGFCVESQCGSDFVESGSGDYQLIKVFEETGLCVESRGE
jgi:hypothetical protein